MCVAEEIECHQLDAYRCLLMTAILRDHFGLSAEGGKRRVPNIVSKPGQRNSG